MIAQPPYTPKPLEPLVGPRTDAWRIRVVVDSAYQHIEDMRLRARQHAMQDPGFAEINREIGLALQHLANVRVLAEAKRVSLAAAGVRQYWQD